MLYLARKVASPEEGCQRARDTLASGAAFEKFLQLVATQGGETRLLDKPDTREGYLPACFVRAPHDMQGVVASIDARETGRIAMMLGAGRQTKEDKVDPLAGLVLNKKPGDSVEPGEVLVSLYTRRSELCDRLRDRILAAYTLQDVPPSHEALVLGRYDSKTWIMTV
jgi:pyrimidine-nucleoside phosphorylase